MRKIVQTVYLLQIDEQFIYLNSNRLRGACVHLQYLKYIVCGLGG